MTKFSRSEFFFYAIIVAFIYVFLSAVLPQRIFVILLNSVFFGVSISVLVVLAPLALRALRTHTFDRVSQLSVGIIITWLSLMIVRFGNLLAHSMDVGKVIVNSPMISLSTYLAILGGVLYITAPGMADDRLRYNREALACSFAVGLFLAVATYFIQGP